MESVGKWRITNRNCIDTTTAAGLLPQGSPVTHCLASTAFSKAFTVTDARMGQIYK